MSCRRRTYTSSGLDISNGLYIGLGTTNVFLSSDGVNFTSIGAHGLNLSNDSPYYTTMTAIGKYILFNYEYSSGYQNTVIYLMKLDIIDLIKNSNVVIGRLNAWVGTGTMYTVMNTFSELDPNQDSYVVSIEDLGESGSSINSGKLNTTSSECTFDNTDYTYNIMHHPYEAAIYSGSSNRSNVYLSMYEYTNYSYYGYVYIWYLDTLTRKSTLMSDKKIDKGFSRYSAYLPEDKLILSPHTSSDKLYMTVINSSSSISKYSASINFLSYNNDHLFMSNGEIYTIGLSDSTINMFKVNKSTYSLDLIRTASDLYDLFGNYEGSSSYNAYLTGDRWYHTVKGYNSYTGVSCSKDGNDDWNELNLDVSNEAMYKVRYVSYDELLRLGIS